MNRLWSEIGFSQEEFESPELEYDDLDNGDNLGGDRNILQTSYFPRKVAHPKPDKEDQEKFSMARIKNFPLNVTEDQIVTFLQTEVDKDITAKDIKTELTDHSINIILGPAPSLNTVAKAIEVLDYNSTKKQFFENRKLYAQLYRPLTPEKPKPVEAQPADKVNTPNPHKVKSAVSNLNQSASNSSKVAELKSVHPKKNLSPHTSLSSAATHQVTSYKEGLRGSLSFKK